MFPYSYRNTSGSLGEVVKELEGQVFSQGFRVLLNFHKYQPVSTIITNHYTNQYQPSYQPVLTTITTTITHHQPLYQPSPTTIPTSINHHQPLYQPVSTITNHSQAPQPPKHPTKIHKQQPSQTTCNQQQKPLATKHVICHCRQSFAIYYQESFHVELHHYFL